MNHYEILGVSQDAIPEVIKAAYKAMSQKYHPDLNGGDEQANAKMQKINEAYTVLKSPTDRAKYDQALKADKFSSEFPQGTASGSKTSPSFDDSQSDDSEEEDFFDDAPEYSRKPANISPQATAPKKLPYFRAVEYAALLGFSLITMAILFSGQSAKPHQSTASNPDTVKIPSIPIPAAPPIRNNEHNAFPAQAPTPASQPTATRRTASAPNGTAWPTSSGYIAGYQSTDYGGSLVNLTNQKTSSALFVKLINNSRSAEDASRYVYLGKHQNFSIVNIAPGDYFLVYEDLASGKYYRTDHFTLTQGVSPANPTQLQFTTARFEFTSTGNGYLDSQQISASEFGEK